MPEFSPHYCHGKLATAFVLSVPGADEQHCGKPVSGDTGANLDAALVLLNTKNAKLFPSALRYDYRITNAFAEPRAKSLGHASSEAKTSEIRNPQNIARVITELAGCNVVVLCGRRAQLLYGQVSGSAKVVIKVAHPGNRGLNRAFPGSTPADSPNGAKQHRIKQWANAVLKQYRASAA